MTQPVPAIFLVDDDASVRRGVGRLLRAAGHRVVAFASADEFLRGVPPEAPGCLLLDVHMPGMSGLKLQSHLLHLRRVLPIVFMSGEESTRDDEALALGAGALAFLYKPLDEARLLSAVERALGMTGRRPEPRRRSSEVKGKTGRTPPIEVKGRTGRTSPIEIKGTTTARS